jgi:exopolysaccharide production protein ExoQ
MGVIVLLGRARRVWEVLKANIPVVLFFLYCGLSTLWSDFPDTTFRRWIKAVGDLVMVLVVLTDADRSAALKLPARVGFLLIPLSILLLKYFPQLARDFNDITGEPEYTGVATSKNGLGMVCMLFGLGSVWRFLDAYRSEEGRRRIGRLVAHGTIVLMVLWLFRLADSMTALICFTIGTGLLLLTASSTVARRPVVVHAFVWVLLMGSLSVVVLGMNETFVQALGRDATLTGRTALWNRVLAMVEHPWFGTGFESFWLGERLERMLGIYRGINQAHNGYIEVFLNLGWVGIGFLALVLVTGYRNVAIALRRDRDAGRVRLAYFAIGVLINLSEASFKMMSPVWIFFLLAIMSVPETSIRKVVRRSEVRRLGATARSPTG